MEIRKVLLRLMLWSLGVAAVCGAVAILTAAEEVIWRVVGTAVATAVASGLMMAVTLLVDGEKTRWSGVVGMWGVVVEYLLVLSLVWGFGNHWWGFDLEERFGFTALFIAITVLPAMLLLRLMVEPETRVASQVGLWLAGVVFLMLEVGCWWQRYWMSEETWGSAGALAGFGTLAVGCLIGVGRDRRHWRWVGVLAAVAGCGIAVVAIWKHLHEGSAVFTVITSIACVVALANVVMMCPLKEGQAWVRYGAIVCGALTAVFVDVDAVGFGKHSSDLLMRLAGASGFMAGCGVLALAVLARLNKGVGQKAVLSEIQEVTLICPGCGKKQAMGVGEGQCSRCHLKFQIRIEEPRCVNCGYLLFMLQSERCPECGTVVGK